MDVTIIGAPSSTKNADKARDPEMHQTRKGQKWFFGMKLHIGVDSQSGLTHRAVVTVANVHDKSKIRSCGEHVFGVVKRVWGFGKVRYRDLANIYLGRQEVITQVRP